MKTEPSASIGVTVSGILAAVWLILKAAGVDVTEDMRAGVDALVAVLITIPAFTGLLIRFFVWSPASVQQATEKAVRTGKAPEIA